MKIKILVFDDDRTFGKILQKHGEAMNLEIMYSSHMDDFCLKALDNNFDVALIDYHLGSFKGDAVCKAVFLKPTLLMSNDPRLENTSEWPSYIADFVKKDIGADAILKRAVKVIQENHL